MIICILYCKSCGAEYKWQASGSYYSLNTPEKYNDEDYCPECKKTIIDSLSVIPKKSEVVWIKTDLIDLDTLLKWEKEDKRKILKEYNERIEKGDVCLPPTTRVFVSLWDVETKQHSRTFQVKGKGKHKDKLFRAFYWPKNRNKEINIVTQVRQDMNNKLIKYELKEL